MEILSVNRYQKLKSLTKNRIYHRIGNDYMNTTTWMKTSFFGSETYTIKLPCFSIFIELGIKNALLLKHNNKT